MVGLAVIVLAVLVSVQSAPRHVRVNRRPGDHPPEGECSNFWMGGISKVHFYTCCNNLDEGPQPYCAGRTYQRASTESYCKPGGYDGGNGKQRDSYRCGGCDGQTQVAVKCKPPPILDVVGTCWVFTKCFTDYCEERYRVNELNFTLDVSRMPDTCYNGVCDAGETTDNCPVDCCYKKNPSQCTWNTKCVPQFCGTPACQCGGEGVFGAGTNSIKILIAALLVLNI
ncbi:uncharacterized protein [Haliotis cracherodii]|uniref:uncharacterized protein n=1 Tax=Haliotis cracherodii TaxID=6455 RepID=UPI0039EC81BF